ncbi:MAG: PD-(D/E)XK nuclease family protein, partial [Microbacterium sp.]
VSALAADPADARAHDIPWPLDPLGLRRPAVARAAELVVEAIESASSGRVTAPTGRWARDLELLLAERDRQTRGVRLPDRIPASRFKDWIGDPVGSARAHARPMPEEPVPATRLGTLFHAWVEQRSGSVGLGGSLDDALWELDDDAPGTTEASLEDADALERLRANFLASEWAHRKPLEVETEIDFAVEGLDGSAHVVICKLDAVYLREDRGGRIEIVDWKTGAAPRTDAEREERMLQLELYRRAYHAKHGVALDEIDVALYYVAEGLVLRG